MNSIKIAKTVEKLHSFQDKSSAIAILWQNFTELSR